MKKLLVLVMVLVASIAMAQSFVSKNVGSFKTVDGTEISVTSNSSGSIFLDSKDTSSWISKDMVDSFNKAIDAALAGIKEIEAQNLDISSTEFVKTIHGDRSNMSSTEVSFLYNVNTFKKGVFVTIRFKYRPLELVLDSATLANFKDLIQKASSQGLVYNDQFNKLTQIVEKIKGFM